MSFLFKNKAKGQVPSTALPPASRDIRSSDGPAAMQSNIPTLNGVLNTSSKPGSPTPAPHHNNVNNSLGSLADSSRSSSAPPQEEMARQQYMRGQPDGAVNGARAAAASPEPKSLRDGGRDTSLSNRSQVSTRMPPSSDSSPYPWSQKRLAFTVQHTNPFPRYGAAVNATSSKDGSIYLMGGLINGSTVKGDLWMVEAGLQNIAGGQQGQMSCYPVATTSEGPGPRVGHASLLVGNAFIVFGGDTKMDEGDQLDDTLYLLNTSTKQWSRALPAGPRPPGRYGHTLNILGSKIYIFGGQVEGYFFNDLVAFDLNALQQATNRWEILIHNTIDGGPPHGQIPPARTNHTMVSWNDRLYLFGGTDGVHWYNDVWSYSPHTNSWTMLECIGYIPAAREGHAAALVGDVMYIFGGRTEEGNDLGDLAAFRISSRRWYTFTNMGPSPSPRSGHSMTTVAGKHIVVLAGEPSSAPRDPVELGLAYVLDTGKIRYPPDSASQTPVNDRVQGTRRPSGDKGGALVSRGPTPQMTQSPQQPAELMDRSRMGSGDSLQKVRQDSGSRLPRMASNGGVSGAPSPAPTGPPPQAPGQQPRQNGVPNARQPTRPSERALSPTQDAERAQRFESMAMANGRQSPAVTRDRAQPPEARVPTSSAPQSPGFSPPEQSAQYDTPTERDVSQQPREKQQQQQQQQRSKPETYQPSQDVYRANSLSRRDRDPSVDMDRIVDSDTPRQSVDDSIAEINEPEPEPEQLPKVRPHQPAFQSQHQRDESDATLSRSAPPQDSGIGSSPALVNQQYEDLLKELEAMRRKNAWFASELALARKSGYQSRSASSGATGTESPELDRAAESFGDDDRPLIEALLKMRAELARVQQAIDEQSRSAAERIAEMEKARDAAISEAVLARARLVGQVAGSGEGSTPEIADRQNELSRKLASSINKQNELSRRIESLLQAIDSEKQGRLVAEETAEAAQKRVAELEAQRHEWSSEVEGLKGQLHEVQTQHRELGVKHAEITSQHQLLLVDKRDLSQQVEELKTGKESHASVLASLKEAMTASQQKSDALERKLDEERQEREALQEKLVALRNEHETRTAELESTTRSLRDAQDMAERHKEEARTHREVVLAGLGKVTDRDVSSTAIDERVALLQQQVEAAHDLVRQNQSAADVASQKLRSAEERIAGLEAYQEQASRESLAIRKQLQAALKDKQGLESEKGELEQRLQGQMLETNALAVQHASLKDILAERGINPAEIRRSRAMDSPNSLSNRFSTPDQSRVKELEQQLESSLRSHDEMKAQFEEVSERDEKMKREYEEKLTALDNDHQAAVKYLRGTEKMLSKMKQELQRVKNENAELRKRVEKFKEEGANAAGAGSSASAPPPEWEGDREKLLQAQTELRGQIGGLEGRIREVEGRLQGTEQELMQSRNAHANSQADLSALRDAHTQSRGDVERLQKENSMLEERARDAENKVQLLLDQVEHSVDNYRRQSRMSGLSPGRPQAAGINGTTSSPFPGTNHLRNLSTGSSADTAAPNHHHPTSGHTRNLSEGAESTYSGDLAPSSAGGDDARNSLALDSLANELDALRTHWETTNKNYRLSDKFDFEKTPTLTSSSNAATPTAAHTGLGIGSGAGGVGDTLASWRSRLDIDDDGESEHGKEGKGEEVKT